MVDSIVNNHISLWIFVEASVFCCVISKSAGTLVWSPQACLAHFLIQDDFNRVNASPLRGLYWRSLLSTKPPCAVNVQVFSMYSLWNNFDVSSVSVSDIFKPSLTLLGCWKKQLTGHFVSVYLVPFCMCTSQRANVFCSSFLTHCPAKEFHHRQQRCGCPKQFGSQQVKQKKGFLGDSSSATAQSVKSVERQRWRETGQRENQRRKVQSECQSEQIKFVSKHWNLSKRWERMKNEQKGNIYVNKTHTSSSQAGEVKSVDAAAHILLQEEWRLLICPG